MQYRTPEEHHNSSAIAHPDSKEKIQSMLNAIYIKPNKKYVCFAEAQKFAQSLCLRTRKEWRAYVNEQMPDKIKKPHHIPAHPDGIYKIKGWQGWKSWLGTADKKFMEN